VALDLGVFHRKAHAVGMREALGWSAVWISLGLAFAVVVIGGLGSLPGAALGALIVGLVRAAAVHYLPEVELFSIYFVMAVVLILRPKGLFSGAEVRKI
jgi:branched-subunit amino acid ABC-type transport system permease component